MIKNKKKLTSISLVIPLFNNEHTAVTQIKTCEKIIASFSPIYEIILCDDKSTDKTKEVLLYTFKKNKNIRIILNKKNLGIANTIRSLYNSAKYKYIILFSVDGDWDPEDIVKMLDTMYKTQSDIVIGKRYKTNYTSYRKIISFFYNFLPQVLFGVTTFDAGSIKIIKKSLLEKIQIISKSIFFEAEIIIRAKRNGSIITKVPVHYYKKDTSKNSAAQFKSVFFAFLDVLKLRFYL